LFSTQFQSSGGAKLFGITEQNSTQPTTWGDFAPCGGLLYFQDRKPVQKESGHIMAEALKIKVDTEAKEAFENYNIHDSHILSVTIREYCCILKSLPQVAASFDAYVQLLLPDLLYNSCCRTFESFKSACCKMNVWQQALFYSQQHLIPVESTDIFAPKWLQVLQYQ